MLINSVNVELLSRESIKAALKQDPVLSQVVDWLKTVVKPARCDVEGGGRKLLSYWSQWGRLLLRDGLVLRCWEKRKDRPRDLPADLFARELCASSVACPS